MKRYVFILAACVGVLSFAASVPADIINLNYSSLATAVDNGPKDGVFDAFAGRNLGAVSNNERTSYRTAFEFDLSGIPAGSEIDSARLVMTLSNRQGTRSVKVYGYIGDGTVQLSDFALNGPFCGDSIGPELKTFTFDVTRFVASLAERGSTFAGFNLREEPANTSTLPLMSLSRSGFPVLNVNYSKAQIVKIDIRPGSSGPGSINTKSKGKIAVAILSGPGFNAPGEVDKSSLTFGRTGDENSLAACTVSEDVNNDGLPDMVCRFNTQSTGFLTGNTQGVLKGKTMRGVKIKGVDSVRIVK